MKKIVLYAFVFLSAISAYAIDPYGSRVDYGNDSSGGGAGAVFMVILGVVGCILYYFLTKSNSEPPKPRKTVQKTESVEAQIARMEREMAQRKEREDQETKGCIIGIIIVAFFVLMIIINS